MPAVAFDLGPTPNPNAMRVGLSAALFERPLTLRSAAEAAANPLGASLLAIPGVVQVFMMADFITVTKQASADWTQLEPALRAALGRGLHA
jgi:hypothetical protein